MNHLGWFFRHPIDTGPDWQASPGPLEKTGDGA